MNPKALAFIRYWRWPMEYGEIREITKLQCAGCDGLYFWIRPLDGEGVCGNCHPFETGVYLDQLRRIAAQPGLEAVAR